MAFGSKRHAPAVGVDKVRFDLITMCIPCLLNQMMAGGWVPEGMDPRMARACARFRPTGMPVERHHVLGSGGGFTMGHRFTFGNCLWHHKGILSHGYTTSKMTAHYGPSLAKGSKPFHEVYGSDTELIRMQDYVLYGDGPLPDGYSAM